MAKAAGPVGGQPLRPLQSGQRRIHLSRPVHLDTEFFGVIPITLPSYLEGMYGGTSPCPFPSSGMDVCYRFPLVMLTSLVSKMSEDEVGSERL